MGGAGREKEKERDRGERDLFYLLVADSVPIKSSRGKAVGGNLM